jgi:hypothetical protein
MDAIIDLGSELLVDLSRTRDPHLRLLLKALGQELAKGSAWVAVNKEVAVHYGLAREFFAPQGSTAAA